MNVQEILFPKIGRCTEEELYFRKTISGEPDGVADADRGFVKAFDLLENRLKKFILESNSLDDFIGKVKCKRYTYNRIKRICVHILCGLEKNYGLHNEYIRVLGFNSYGQRYLSSVKKKLKLPIIYSYKENISPIFDLEYVSTCIYDYSLGKSEYTIGVQKK